MKLFYSPGACSLGIHVLLEEIGQPFETVLFSTRDGSLQGAEYRAINPKSKVPALQRDDGSVLTEYPAIALYLGRTHAAAGLIPPDADGEARMMETVEYIVSTMHMQGFARIGRTVNFALHEEDYEAVRTRGREILARGLDLMERQLAGREWLVGPYSLADSALLFIENWMPRAAIELGPHCAAHFARMKARPAVQRAFAKEGIAL